jgi:predicted dehydrogenase
MTRTLGVGIVGLSAEGGWAARAHVPALRAVDGLELRALTASAAASTRAAAAAHGVTGHASVAELAADDAVDLVVVAVKVPHHRELVLPALAAGKAVYCEWPLAVDLAEAQELERAAAGIPSFVGLQGRTLPAVRRAAEVVATEVGDVLSATVVASTAGWGAETSERGRYLLDRANGATMLSIAFGHAIDAVAAVVGELTDVAATTAIRRPQVRHTGTGELLPMTAEDQIAISGTLASGAVLSAHYRGGTVAGPGFSLVVDGTAGTLEVAAPNHPHTVPLTVQGTTYEGSPVHALTHAYAAIRDDLRDGTQTAPGFAHAVRRHRLLDAIQRSAATGRRVAV